MRPPPVIVDCPISNRHLQMSFVERNQEFQTLATQAAAQSLAYGVRIPMKWGTDSDEVGQRQSEATLVMAMITEVPHFSQVVLAWWRAIGIISFLS